MKDNIKLLKKTVKRQLGEKKKAGAEWKERKDQVQKDQDIKYKKRSENIQSRIDLKKNKRTGGGVSKKKGTGKKPGF